MDDAALVARIAKGDRQAFGDLYERHQATVYRFARQMGGSAEVAEDVTHDVFLSIMRAADRFDATRAAFTTYLYAVTRNAVRRRLTRWRPVEYEDGEAASSDPLEVAAREETIARVRAAVLRLTAHYREVVVLCDLHERSYAEAAAILDCPEGTVRSRLHRARRVLASRLSRTNEAAIPGTRRYRA